LRSFNRWNGWLKPLLTIELNVLAVVLLKLAATGDGQGDKIICARAVGGSF
jgi:hypothetical protein